jgi:hypothetical protein
MANKDWHKGMISANPNGRPKGSIIVMNAGRAKLAEPAPDVIAKKIRELFPVAFKKKTITNLDAILYRTIYAAQTGNTKAVTEILNRCFGLPASQIELTGANGKDLIPVQFVIQENKQVALIDKAVEDVTQE